MAFMWLKKKTVGIPGYAVWTIIALILSKVEMVRYNFVFSDVNSNTQTCVTIPSTDMTQAHKKRKKKLFL